MINDMSKILIKHANRACRFGENHAAGDHPRWHGASLPSLCGPEHVTV